MSATQTKQDTLLIPCMADEKSEKLADIDHAYITVENRPFRVYTVFYIGEKKRLEKEIKRKEDVNLDSIESENELTFSGVTIPLSSNLGHSLVLIWMPTFNWTLEDLETLSHECLHATIMVMRMSGVKSRIFSAEDDDSCDDEGICYGQSMMFASILTELSKMQMKKMGGIISSKTKKNPKKTKTVPPQS